MSPSTGAYPSKIWTSDKKYCWKEGMYTQPQASDFCAKVSGRLPVIHTSQDNEDVGMATGSVILLICDVLLECKICLSRL